MVDSSNLSERDVVALGHLLCALGVRRLGQVIRSHAMSPVFGSEHERTAALSAELQALHGEMFNHPGDANWQAVSDYLLLQWESQQPWPLPRRRKRSGLIRWLRDRKDIA